MEVPEGFRERPVVGPAVSGGARQTTWKRYDAPEGGAELAVGCYAVDLPFFAEELEPIILERLHLASERTDVAGRIQGGWTYGFPEPHGLARSRRVSVPVVPPATKPEATELDLYGFDADGTLHGCFVLCRGCESQAALQVPLAAPPSPGAVGRTLLYGARHPDHAGLAFLGLLCAVAGLLIASRKRPQR